MARSGVQYEDVQRAIEDLIARGESPSVQKIREVLGTGSFTTISEHLREWRAHREANRDVPPPRGMPASLQELAETLWQKAQDAAIEALGHYREEAERRVDEARAAMAEACRQAEDAEQRESALATHLANTEQRLEDRSNALARSDVERDALAEQVTKLNASHHRLDAHLARLQQEKEQASKEHQQVLANLEARHRERLAQEEHRHESAEARLMGLLDEARQERQAADKSHAARVGQLEKRQEQLERQLQEARALLGEEEKRHREADWARSRAEEQARTHEHAQALLQARIDEQKRLLEDQAQRLRDLEAQLNRYLWQSPSPSPKDVDKPSARHENDEGSATAEPPGTPENEDRERQPD